VSRAAEIGLLTLAGIILPLPGLEANSQDIPPAQARSEVVAAGSVSLQLEVFVNGVSSGLIATVLKGEDGSLAIDPKQLRNVGVTPVKEAERADGLIEMSKLPAVSVDYDEQAQLIRLTVDETARASRQIDARETGEESDEPQRLKAQTGTGALVNYTLYGSSGGESWASLAEFRGVSGWFEGRAFSPFGIVSSSYVASFSEENDFEATRLDTSWSYSNEEQMISYRAGDIITGGLGWTRPVRLGGMRIQRNFALRPDIVTMPLPELSGSAAVPSTVDVYVNNARRFSRDVPAGPFSITNVPIVTGNGIARLVVRDVLGRQTVSETPFYASSDLLAPGLLDFSVEAGFARRFYGTQSNDYDDAPMGSITARYGVNDWLTVEGHAEGGGGLLNGGLGGVFSLGNYGVGSLAAAYSRFNSETGYQLAASAEAELWGLQFFARTQRTFGDYNDIASATATFSDTGIGSKGLSAKPPRSLDQLSVSVPLKFDASTLNFSLTQLETAENDVSRLFGITANRPLGKSGNLFATAYVDLERKNSFGLFVGLSWTFGGGISSSANISSDDNGTSFSTDIVKSERPEIGSFAWRLRGSTGADEVRSAAASYRAPFARLQAGVEQFNGTTRANAQIEGAVVLAGGDVFLSNRVDDAFGIVKTGAPGVDVLVENTPIGHTNRRGKILLPNLRAYDTNNISIDPTNLPIDATISTTRQKVVPSDRGGAVIDFNVVTDMPSALVTLRDDKGEFLETGSLAKLNDGTGDFVIGYDGQAFLDGIKSKNRVLVTQPNRGKCEAIFSVKSTPGTRTVVPDVMCRAVP
jgi:outer membrane usher protein